MDQPCPVCRGERWVCEDHPAQPWQHDGCGGAGVACRCNPSREIQWQRVHASVDDGPLLKLWRRVRAWLY